MDVIGQNGNDGLHYEEEKKDKVIKKAVTKYIKLPLHLKNDIRNALKHAQRKGEKIPEDIDRFFES